MVYRYEKQPRDGQCDIIRMINFSLMSGRDVIHLERY